MELSILQGLQQDIKIFLLSPILCAIFRFLFIKKFRRDFCEQSNVFT